ncbi:hypothetical protein HYX04_01175 [Candidatus Woesearchaeota archaeon]|nr:hypothetical protein [Candidatus Woesearchaeota archaeon]
MDVAQTLANIVDSLSPTYLLHYFEGRLAYLKDGLGSFPYSKNGNGAPEALPTTGNSAVEEQVLISAHPRTCMPPNGLKPANENLAYLEADNILRLTKKVANYDGFRFGRTIKKATKEGSKAIGFFDPNTGIITTDDEDFYLAVSEALKLTHKQRLNYSIGIKTS